MESSGTGAGCRRHALDGACLELAQQDQTDLQNVIRANLAVWREQLHPLQAVVSLASSGKPVFYDFDTGPSAAFLLGGSRIVTSNPGGSIQIRDAVTLQQIGQSLQHSGGVNVMVVSPNGRLFLTGGPDGTARLWDAETHQQLGRHLMHDGVVTSACFSPDGAKIVTGSADKQARLWDTNTQQIIGVPFQHTSELNAVSFNTDGSQFMTADSIGFHVWNTETGEQIGEVIPYSARVFSLQFNPTQPTFLFGSQDQTVQMRDTATYDPVGFAFMHPEPIHSVILSAQRSGTDYGLPRRKGPTVGLTIGQANRFAYASRALRIQHCL